MSKGDREMKVEALGSVHDQIDRAQEEAILRLQKIPDWGGIMMDSVYKFAKKIQVRYPDYNKYRAYHQLIGSTPPDGVIDGDFEGEFSVLNFFESIGR